MFRFLSHPGTTATFGLAAVAVAILTAGGIALSAKQAPLAIVLFVIGGLVSLIALVGTILMLLHRDDTSPTVTEIDARVVSFQQMGGQTAGTITNIGLQPRTFTVTNRNAIIDRLSAFAGTQTDMMCLMGGADSLQFAQEILELIEAAGWKVDRTAQGVVGDIRGELLYPMNDPAMQELQQCLADTGFQASCRRSPVYGNSEREIFVGA